MNGWEGDRVWETRRPDGVGEMGMGDEKGVFALEEFLVCFGRVGWCAVDDIFCAWEGVELVVARAVVGWDGEGVGLEYANLAVVVYLAHHLAVDGE